MIYGCYYNNTNRQCPKEKTAEPVGKMYAGVIKEFLVGTKEEELLKIYVCVLNGHQYKYGQFII